VAIPPPRSGEACLITGASSGLGVAFARALAGRGHELILTARRTDRLQALAAELRAEHSATVDVVPCDLSEHGHRDALIEAATGPERTVSVLINSAGFATLGALNYEQTVKLVQVNAEAAAHLCAVFAPLMAQRGEGAILNVASIIAFAPVPGAAAYAAAKTFVLNYTLALHGELARTGVAVTALAPGAMPTEFVDVSGTERLARRIPRAMWTSPEQAACTGLHGLEQARALVIPGRPYRAIATVAQLCPRRLLVAGAGRLLPR
jgi:short-subunit dehydrogenase